MDIYIILLLRRKHSLKGRPKGPLIRRFQELGQNPGPLARLSRENRTEDLTLADIGEAIARLTGERPADLALMAGIHENDVEAMRRLLHCSILEANEIGQDIEPAVPEGQRVGFSYYIYIYIDAEWN